MNYTDFLDNRDDFAEKIKNELSQRSFETIEGMKKDMANEFLQNNEEDDESY